MVTMGRMFQLLDNKRLFKVYLQLSFRNAIRNFDNKTDQALAIILSIASGFCMVDWFPDELNDDDVFKELDRSLNYI